MKKYDIIKFPISDTESMWDVITYNKSDDSWKFRRSFDTRTEARKYVKHLKYAKAYQTKRRYM